MDFTQQIVEALVTNWALVAGLAIIAGWAYKSFVPHLKPHQHTAAKPVPLVVQLDPSVSQVIQQTADSIRAMSDIVHKTDAEGTPLVYADRRQEQAVVKLAEIIREIAESQRRLADSLSRMDDRFDAHDKGDAILFSKIRDSQERIEQVMNTNRDSLILVSKDHQTVLSLLEEIKDMQRDILNMLNKK